ncbi:PAS domain-containing protein [Roseibacillus ishigakijimensis]|uniref:histidine kinase n=1 Tax=Roseibacillus ishigakijimensis TaxID=454146 RepID=A0A934RKR6_9BACT|nr:PAS domain-containing protein [Roseibacillus ishigakijimensis]MBK1832525.1 PAS domain-containing protein [Roseibacillus ishigakijimensis]
MKLGRRLWSALLGSLLFLSFVALAVAPIPSVKARWFICALGLFLLLLLFLDWNQPRRHEHDLLKRLRVAERERDEVERYFSALMDSVPSNIYFKDLESRFVRVNQSMAHWVKVGHPRDLVGKSDHDLFKPEHAEQARADELEIIRTGKSIEGYVEKEIFPDGKEGWVLSTKLPFRDHGGKIVGTMGISSDVSEMVFTSKALERERNTLRSLIDSIPDNIYIRDRDGKYVVVNKALANFVGIDDPEAVCGKTPGELFGPEKGEAFIAEDKQVMETGEPVLNRRSQLRNNKGELRDLLISKVAVRDEEGKVFGIVGMNRDITAEISARRKQKQAERQMREILEHSPAPIYVKSLSGRYLMVNERFERLFNLKEEDILGKEDKEVFKNIESAETVRELDRLVIESGKAHQTDEELITPEGPRTYVSSKFPMRDAQGRIYAVGGISIDITERKEAEEAIRKINDELRQANENLTKAHEQLMMAEKMESVGRLAAGVAHEVKNPLAMIGMGLELLARRIPEEDTKAADTVERMRRGIERAKTIVKGLVDFSSDRSLDIKPISAKHIIESSLDLVDYELQKAQIKIIWEQDEPLPEILVDQVRAEQVLLNLIMNSIHAMEGPGSITIETDIVTLEGVIFDAGSRQRERPKDGDLRLRILLRDTGPGIPEEVLDKIFDPFFTTKETGKGTGLGLAVSNKIIELHGGKLAMRNRSDGAQGAEAEVQFKIATGKEFS